MPGPDVIVGDLSGLAQFGGTSGTQVGLAVGTDSCNAGVVPLNWFALPTNDHPVIPQNLYRMSGGATNDRTFEQIGQSSVKHAFTALQQNLCNFGCNNSGTGTLLGSGCSDPYTASLNSGPNLGSRAWINPFTGAYPRGDSATPPNNHTRPHPRRPLAPHPDRDRRPQHDPEPRRQLLRRGAVRHASRVRLVPDERWSSATCTTTSRTAGTTSSARPARSASAAAPTVRMQPAITAWTGATRGRGAAPPGLDGVAYVAYKVTNPSAGVWHYEYAIYNYNLDRAIQAFGIPKPAGVTLTNVGFHAPPQHPGWSADGTVGSAGYSSTPWAQSEADGVVTWGSQTMAQNPNANAIRWGTLYNIRFDSNQPPAPATGTLTFFKTRARVRFGIQAPTPHSLGV